MKLPSPPAYSLIFAFIIMTVVMIITSTAIAITNDKLMFFRELEGGVIAKMAARSAAELGVLAMKDHAAGYEKYLPYAFAQDENEDGTPESYGGYQIYGRAQKNSNDGSNTWYIPMPGTGTAGNEDDCTLSDTDHNGEFDLDLPVDHPCNWNKMLYGQNVTIPLYTEDSEGNLLFPYNLDFTSWHLKVRTPCVDPSDDPETCEESGRYELDDGVPSDGSIYEEDDSVIFWQITGEGTRISDGSAVSISVIPNDAIMPCGFSDCRDSMYNTEIYESLINTNAEVLSATSNEGAYLRLYEMSIGDTDGDDTRDVNLSALSILLNIVTPLKADGGQPIPYLEWQFLIEGGEGFADNKSVIQGEGFFLGATHNFYHSYLLKRSTIGQRSGIYTLSN